MKKTACFRQYILLSILIIAFPMLCIGQGRYEEFKQVAQQHGLDSKETVSFLEKWQNEEPNNVEMLNSWFLYHIIKGTEQIEISQDLKDFVAEHNAMLPDTLSCFKSLKVQNINILKDKGDGMKNYEEALLYLNKAIELYPRVLELYTNKIDAYMRKYEHKYATVEALRLARMFKDKPEEWKDFYGNTIANDTAKLMFDDVMASTMGQLMQRNELELSMIVNDTLMTYYPDEMAYKFNKGNLYIQTYQYDDAIKYYKGLLTGNVKDDGNTLYVLMQLCMQTGDTLNLKKYANDLKQSDNAMLRAEGYKVLNSLKPFHIDFVEIEAWMKDHRKDYDLLVQRFKAFDQTLTNDELAKIYFGHACTEKLTSTTLWDNEAIKALMASENGENFEKLDAEATKCLELHPASIAALMVKMFACMGLKRTDEGEKYSTVLVMLANMIQKDADDNGKDGMKVYKILWRADEDFFVEFLMNSEEREKTSVFSNPAYFIDKEE